MNKTVSINLGGFYFHIDEDAYQKLNRYFDAIRRSLSPDTKDEIMSDIEGRIAELLSEKLKSDKQVVGTKEVEDIIAVMGQPEDYKIDEDTTGEQKFKDTYNTGIPDYSYPRTKKFYRDGEKGMIGGVCAGLSHYFRIDPLWIRIVFILSLFVSFGSSTFIYLLLWVLIPKAVSTTEKLEMTGEPINISNIEKKVKEEIDQIAGKLQSVDYDKLGANAKYGAEKLGSGIGTVFSAIFTVIAKVVGAFIAVTSAIMLGVAVVFFISLLFTSSFKNSMWYPWLGGFNYTETSVPLMGVAVFFVVAIPLFILFLLGLKILVDNLKPIGNVTRYTLLAIWLISAISVIYISVNQAAEISAEGKIVSKTTLNVTDSEMLEIKFRYNNYFDKSIDYNDDFKFRQDSLGNDVIYSNNISLYILKTDEKKPFLQIEKLANGKSSSEARERAEKIKYGFKFENNILTLDNYLLTDLNNKYRNQSVEVYLYLPENTVFKCDENVQKYDRSDDDFFNLWWDDSSYTYMVTEDNVKCLTCPVDGEGAEFGENGDEIPPPPPAPEHEHVRINAGGKGEIHINDDNVDIHVNVDSLHVRAKSKRNN
ncbi:PspC domain-containing protein [Flavobacterium sp. DG1-102-2]|uniref:PspC domain-containing protein n=1 Tax=Flavobacterium sp. DG1-102-2 TaxID=3081663 RepID=UPI002949F2A8|nr:PspC domain-containing protein [Flavobacterium sp. DG1-102-2]MDV6169850.1 PspC domain-containing protein [Flavobacterium sp. DG1-102-2]